MAVMMVIMMVVLVVVVMEVKRVKAVVINAEVQEIERERKKIVYAFIFVILS